MAYFLQQAALSGVFLPNGHRISLDFVDDATQNGYVQSDNGYVVNQIRSAIASHTGGWLEVTEAEYNDALKKKANPGPQSASQRRRALNAGMFQSLRGNPVASVAGVPASKPDPIVVPKPEEMKLPVRPRVGKLKT